ncbi:MAG: glycosyltransferase [Butyrivibrio sp.]|nr:glycosyltransferase [Butyrivibrio sp.]
MDDVLVSVVCITYNHESYIRDTLEGIIHQNVEFKYEAIVHDDASTDNTPQIIQEYEKKYPDLFRVIYESENQCKKRGLSSITMDILKKCRGRYIAICEGDDFWIDNNKLRIQIDWMERHPDYFMTAHNALLMDYKKDALEAMNPYLSEKEISPEELIMQYNGNIPSASIIMRADIKNMEHFFMECGVGDIPMQLYSIAKGKVYYFDRIMSVYRHNHKGSWCVDTLNSDIEKVILHYAKMIRFIHEYDEYTKKIFSKIMNDKVLYYLFIAFRYSDNLQVTEFMKKAQKLIEESDESLKKYIEDIFEAYKQFYSENYLSAGLRNFIRNYQHVYIWGTGYYGKSLAEKFRVNGIEYDGFIVSDEIDTDNEFMGKPVYKISEACRKQKNAGIIGAVNSELWKSIKSTLEDNKVTEYCYMLCI